MGRYAEYAVKYRDKNPEKIAAHQAVHRALRHGDLRQQPCEVCGEPNSEAHHADYSKPLSVEWLCKRHHRQKHLKKKNELRTSLVSRTCEVCGCSFHARQDQLERGRGRFCSKSCLGKCARSNQLASKGPFKITLEGLRPEYREFAEEKR